MTPAPGMECQYEVNQHSALLSHSLASLSSRSDAHLFFIPFFSGGGWAGSVLLEHLNQMLSDIWGLAELPLQSRFPLGLSSLLRQPAGSWFPTSQLCLQAPRCVSVTLLQLLQHCSRKRKTRGGMGEWGKSLNCCCLFLLFSVHFMQLQTQPTLTRVQ